MGQRPSVLVLPESNDAPTTPRTSVVGAPTSLKVSAEIYGAPAGLHEGVGSAIKATVPAGSVHEHCDPVCDKNEVGGEGRPGSGLM